MYISAVCLCTPLRVCLCVCVSMHAWKPEVSIKCLPQFLQPYFMRQGLSLNLEDTKCLG